MAKLERKGWCWCIADEWDDEKQVFSVIAVPPGGHTPGLSEHEAVREAEANTSSGLQEPGQNLLKQTTEAQMGQLEGLDIVM